MTALNVAMAATATFALAYAVDDLIAAYRRRRRRRTRP